MRRLLFVSTTIFVNMYLILSIIKLFPHCHHLLLKLRIHGSTGLYPIKLYRSDVFSQVNRHLYLRLLQTYICCPLLLLLIAYLISWLSTYLPKVLINLNIFELLNMPSTWIISLTIFYLIQCSFWEVRFLKLRFNGQFLAQLFWGVAIISFV